jgi:hypothetical protein
MSAPDHEKKVAEELRLRPERPQVTRLSRRVLIALAGVSLASVLGLALWALRENSCKGPPPELYNTDARTTPDGFDGLPIRGLRTKSIIIGCGSPAPPRSRPSSGLGPSLERPATRTRLSRRCAAAARKASI